MSARGHARTHALKLPAGGAVLFPPRRLACCLIELGLSREVGVELRGGGIRPAPSYVALVHVLGGGVTHTRVWARSPRRRGRSRVLSEGGGGEQGVVDVQGARGASTRSPAL